jgi:hypothetical protein
VEKSEIEKFSFKVGQEVFIILEVIPGNITIQSVNIISYDVDTVCVYDGDGILFIPFENIFLKREYAEQTLK